MLILLGLILLIPTIFAEVPRDSRVDCLPNANEASQDICHSLGCIWDSHFELIDPTVPLCYFPKESGYLVNYDNSAEGSISLKKSKIGGQSAYGYSFDSLSITYNHIRASTLKVTIAPLLNRFVPPIHLNEKSDNSDSGEQLEFDFKETPLFSFTVRRDDNSSQTNIWDTSIGGLVFASQFIQIATYLPTDLIYGFGENVHQTLKHDFSSYQTWGMYSRDAVPEAVRLQRKNYYGVHPFYMGIEPSGKAHGVFILNSNAQEITTGPAPHLIYRTIGGQLDIYFFAGPKPEDVVRQYQQLIGHPDLPPYWAFGYQLCRYGFTGVNEINDTVTRIQKAQIPFDVIYSDIDYMDRFKDFTIASNANWSNLPDFVNEVHKKNVKVVLIFDPAIQVDYETFERAMNKSAAFIEWPRADMVQHEIQDKYPLAKNTKIMLGVVWPDRHVAFPDFFDPTGSTQEWWKEEIEIFHEKVGFDGVWLDMNEPSNFGTNLNRKFGPNDIPGHSVVDTLKCPLSGPDSTYDMPPYKTINTVNYNAPLSESTLCLVGVGGKSGLRLYDTHNLFGFSEVVATRAALDTIFSKRTPLFSRSTFPSAGHYGGHWLGDNLASWEDLRASIIGSQEFNLFGIPYVGADICGFRGTTTEELCLRWQQLGAFYSFFRNHNDIASPPQDPAQWESVAFATRVANLFRYEHLPYLYSLHYRASLFGGTVFRPLFFEFPLDSTAQRISHQFMWGPSFLVLPVLYPNQDYVHGYLPNETWYSASFAHKYGILIPPGYSDFNAPRDTPLPTFVRGNSIIPRQRPGLTTAETFNNEFQLLVALSAKSARQTAQGELYWDDGESFVSSNTGYYYYQFSFEVNENDTKLVITSRRNGNVEKVVAPRFSSLEIFGYQWKPDFDSITVNQRPVASHGASYSTIKQIAVIGFKDPIVIDSTNVKWVIEWNNSGRGGRSIPDNNDDDTNNSTVTPVNGSMPRFTLYSLLLYCFCAPFIVKLFSFVFF